MVVSSCSNDSMEQLHQFFNNDNVATNLYKKLMNSCCCNCSDYKMDEFNFDGNATDFYECNILLHKNMENIKQHYNLNGGFWMDLNICYDFGWSLQLFVYQFYELLRYLPFKKYVEKIKQNRLMHVEIPYDEPIFRNFLKSYKPPYHDYSDAYYIKCIRNNELKCKVYHELIICAMLVDDEFAYTYLYYYKQIHAFEPFIEHKLNYEQRHNRLAMVHEKMFDGYNDEYGIIEMFFCNDYLIQMVLRFL